MELKDLQREIIDAERLAERGTMLLQVNERCTLLQRENEALKQENEELKRQLAAKEAKDGD